MHVSFWKHHPLADQTAAALVRATLDYQRRFNFDFIKLTPAGTWLAVCHGALDADTGDHLGRRAITQPVITQPDDWLRLPRLAAVAPPAMLREQIAASRAVCAGADGVPVYATVFSPVSQAVQLAGPERFRAHLAQAPDAVAEGLHQLTDNLHYVLAQLADTGASGLYYVLQHARAGALTPADYAPLAAYELACLHRANSLFRDVLVHLHGEGVYWPGGEPFGYGWPERVQLHYSNHPTNPPAGAETHAVVGVSTEVLTRLRTEGEMRAWLSANRAGAAWLMAECVLPLDFPDHQTRLWQRAVQAL